MCVERQLSIVNVEYRLARMSSQFHGMTHTLLLDGLLSTRAFFKSALTRDSSVLAPQPERIFVHLFRTALGTICITVRLFQISPILYPENPQGAKHQSDLLSMEQNKDATFLTCDAIFSLACTAEIPISDSSFSVLPVDHAGVPPVYTHVAGMRRGSALREIVGTGRSRTKDLAVRLLGHSLIDCL
ncbi:hypothetical protein BKA93DRAFT_522016 [Sparassis latifolia]